MPLLTDCSLDELIDEIYEAAVIPEAWSSVLDKVAQLADAALASLLAYDGTVQRWVGTGAALALIDKYKVVETTLANSRIPRLVQKKGAGFVTDYDLFGEEEIENQPFYTEFLRPLGYGWVVGAFIEVPTGEVLVVSAERRFDRGPVEQRYVDVLDKLRPHLARAALCASRLRLERARAMTEALEIIGLPAAVIFSSGRLLSANQKFNGLIPSVFLDQRQRLRTVNKAADCLLAKFLSDGVHSIKHSRSIPIAAVDHHPAMIVHFVPINGRARDIFPNSTSLVLVTPVIPAEVPSANLLQGLFDLTPGESKVAHGIGQSHSVDDVSRTLGLSRETVRSRLKSILAKTGMHRQAGLANLLGGLPKLNGHGDKTPFAS
jgi:DNA-binding CsgD family transcriptional regulator